MASDRFSLAGKRALVLGGSSGIGREIALGYRAAGARVVPVGRTPEKVAEVVERLRGTDPKAEGHSLDLTDLTALGRLVAALLEAGEGIDILVNSQGTTGLEPAEDLVVADYDRIMDTNLKSVFFACTEVGRHMLARGRGAVVNIASVAAFSGFPQAAVYCMSKWGVVGLIQTLATEWATRGVRVNAIAPGFFMTPLNRERMSAERKERALGRTPMGRFGELDELVNAAIYLASDGASYVTGDTIRVDGGFRAAGL